MPRDYKNSRARRDDALPGWMWGLGGLAIGLSIALAVHLREDRLRSPAAPVANAAAVPSSARAESDAAAARHDDESKFDFYKMLPQFEVVIPETEREVSEGGRRNMPVSQSGTYVLQAGSFRNFADADRMKAQLALLGLESQIQKVTIDDHQWHRVRLGPYRDLDTLQGARRQLRQADINVLLLRVGD